MTYLGGVPDNPFALAKSWSVFGSAGTGKSYALRTVMKNLIATGVRPSEIMYIVYNRAPAMEFVKSVRDLFPEYDDSEFTYWGTHHAVAKRMLKLKTSCILDGKDLEKWGAEHGFPLPHGDEGRRMGWNPVLASLETKMLTGNRTYTEPERKLKDALDAAESKGFYTHTGYLVSACVRGIMPGPTRFVFVDEAQDNAPVQFRYLESVLPHVEGMMLAGDDKQAVNAWRGASSNGFLGFPVDRRVSLPKSYRCPAAVLTYGNRIASGIRVRSPCAVEPADTGGVAIRTHAANAFRLAAETAKSGGRTLCLVRTNAQKPAMAALAGSCGIPVDCRDWRRVDSVLRLIREARETGDIGRLLEHSRSFSPKEAFGERNLALLKLGGDPKELIPDHIPPSAFGLSDAGRILYKSYVAASAAGIRPMEIRTIHSAKGMEAETVILLADMTAKVWDGMMADPDAERRVWYVGATRARRNLFVITSSNRGRICPYL